MDNSIGYSDEEYLLPLIDGRVCTGCGECVDACVTGVLGIVRGQSTIIRPELCSYCGDCEEACSNEGIALVFEVVFSERGQPRGQTAPR